MGSAVGSPELLGAGLLVSASTAAVGAGALVADVRELSVPVSSRGPRHREGRRRGGNGAPGRAPARAIQERSWLARVQRVARAVAGPIGGDAQRSRRVSCRRSAAVL